MIELRPTKIEGVEDGVCLFSVKSLFFNDNAVELTVHAELRNDTEFEKLVAAVRNAVQLLDKSF